MSDNREVAEWVKKHMPGVLFEGDSESWLPSPVPGCPLLPDRFSRRPLPHRDSHAKRRLLSAAIAKIS
jgi:hypothetical protein